MKLFKSFENLEDQVPKIDPIEAILDLQNASMELDSALEGLQDAIKSCEIYSEIVSCIDACGGVSKSLEILFGENFSSTANMREEASKESFEWAKTAWEWIKAFFVKLWNWFRSIFTNVPTIKDNLKKLKKRTDLKFPMTIRTPFGTENGFTAMLKVEAIEKYIDAIKTCRAKFTKADSNISGTAEYDENGNPKGEAVGGTHLEIDPNELDSAVSGIFPDLKAGEIDFSTSREISNKAELDGFVNTLLDKFDDIKKCEELFKTAEKELSALIKDFEKSANANGQFLKVQSKMQGLTADAGKYIKKSYTFLIRQSQMVLTAARTDKSAKAEEK